MVWFIVVWLMCLPDMVTCCLSCVYLSLLCCMSGNYILHITIRSTALSGLHCLQTTGYVVCLKMPYYTSRFEAQLLAACIVYKLRQPVQTYNGRCLTSILGLISWRAQVLGFNFLESSDLSLWFTVRRPSIYGHVYGTGCLGYLSCWRFQ